MMALVVLLIAIALCALVVFFGPAAGEKLMPLLGPSNQENFPAIESLFTAVIFGSLLLFALAGGRATKVNPLGLGRRPAMMSGVGALIGVIGVAAAASYAWLAGTLTEASADPQGAGLLVWGTLIVLFGAAVEEIYFRGWLQPVMIRKFGPSIGILLTAIAFATLHVMGGARSPTTLANLFLGGLLFGLLAARGGGIAGAVAAHFAWNWSEQILLGLDPNPGVGSFGAFLNLELSGPAIWGGSEEGLNASLAMTMTLAALLVPLLILSRGKGQAGGLTGAGPAGGTAGAVNT